MADAQQEMATALISRRVPGQYARASVRRLRMRCLIVLGAFGVATDLLGRALAFRGAEFELADVGLLCVCLVILHYVLPVVERMDQGAAGEEYVGSLLDELRDDGWHVLHDAPFRYGNVDHIAVGPAGLFTFETKSNPGPVKVRRVHGAILRQAHSQRDELQRVAGARVEPVVVYSRAWVDHPGSRRKGVRVLPARMLLNHLRHQTPSLSDDEVGDIHERILVALGEPPRRDTRLPRRVTRPIPG